jgi:NADPH-dependent F420 reductase
MVPYERGRLIPIRAIERCGVSPSGRRSGDRTPQASALCHMGAWVNVRASVVAAEPHNFAGAAAMAAAPAKEPGDGFLAGSVLMSTQQVELPDVSGMSIGILGGTGDQGKGLARRFAVAGHHVIIGSRSAERAQQAAESLGDGLLVRGAQNPVAAREADVVIVAVPWDGHKTLLESLRDELAGKIVIDCVNPLGFDKQGAFALPVEEGSAAQQAAAVLTGSTVVAAFHHVSAVILLDPEIDEVQLDVLVLGDDREATGTVQALAGQISGVRGVYGGRLRNAHQIEAFTANLISINRRYKTHAGIRVTGV